MASSAGGDDDEFSAFESGASEYASAESGASVDGAEGAEDAIAIAAGGDRGAVTAAASSSVGDEDDFFDAFAVADGPVSVEEGSGGDGGGESAAEKSGEGGQSSVHPGADLFNVSEPANTAQPAEVQVDESNPKDIDPFGAFDGISEAQGDPASDVAAAQKEADATPTADLFGDFGVAEADPPTTTAASADQSDSVGNAPHTDNGPSDTTNDEVPWASAKLHADDFTAFDSIPPTQTDPEKLNSTEGGVNGGGADALSAFDALGVQDAPLPSLDSFASGASEEDKPEVGNGLAVTSGEDEALNGEHANGGSHKEGGGSVEVEATQAGHDANADIIPTSNKGEGGGADASATADDGIGAFEAPSEPQTEDLFGTPMSADEPQIQPSANGDIGDTHLDKETVSAPSDEEGAGHSGENGVAVLPEGNVGSEATREDTAGDDFGGFASPEGDQEQDGAGAAEPGSDDAFGVFASPEVDAFAATEPTNESTVLECDDIGGFSSFEQGPTIPPAEDNEAPVTQPLALGEADGFVSNGDGDFGGFSSSGEAEPKEEGVNQQDDDDFGGFSSFEDATANPPPEEETLVDRTLASDILNDVPVSEDGENASDEPLDGNGDSGAPNNNIEEIVSELHAHDRATARRHP